MSDIPNEKIISRIQKLFALGESPNEAEASAAIAKAHELLREYNLALSDLPSSSGGAEGMAISQSVERKGSEELWRTMLLANVCLQNYCALIVLKGRGSYTWKLFGREANIAASLSMFDYLSRTIRRLSDSANEVYGGEEAGFSKKEFRFAMIHRLYERMEEQRLASMEQTSTALTVVSTEAQDLLRKEHPRTKSRNRRADTNSFSAGLGRATADSVSLNRQIGGRA